VPTVEGAGPWIAGSSPAEHATGVAASVRPTVTFGRDVDPGSVVASETVWLVDGRNSRIVEATVSLSGRTMTAAKRSDRLHLRAGTAHRCPPAAARSPAS
jgi:hypothetical protein